MKSVNVPIIPGDRSANAAQGIGPLTPEQVEFADVVGREIARFWRESQAGGRDVDPRPEREFAMEGGRPA